MYCHFDTKSFCKPAVKMIDDHTHVFTPGEFDTSGCPCQIMLHDEASQVINLGTLPELCASKMELTTMPPAGHLEF